MRFEHRTVDYFRYVTYLYSCDINSLELFLDVIKYPVLFPFFSFFPLLIVRLNKSYLYACPDSICRPKLLKRIIFMNFQFLISLKKTGYENEDSQHARKQVFLKYIL